MFDLRYHIASLAAVFIALAVGIVIGVAIATGGKVNKRALDLRDSQIAGLKADLDARGQQLRDAQAEGAASADVLASMYPELLHGRLHDRAVGVLSLGSDDRALDAIEDVLGTAGAGTPVRVTTLGLPFDADEVLATVRSDPAFASVANLEDLGHALGRQLADGGDTVWSLVRTALVEQASGSPDGSLDGVVVISAWQPEQGDDAKTQRANGAAEELIRGLLDGLEESGTIVVGVARWQGLDGPATLGAFQGIPTVNDVDLTPGRIALALVLAGAREGHYGIGASDGVAPPVEPLDPATLTTTAAAGGG